MDVQKSIQAGRPGSGQRNGAAALFEGQRASSLHQQDQPGRSTRHDRRVKDLLQDMKKVGPDLKEVRMKLRPEWVPVWLQNPHAFRPTTQMPRFRLDDDELPAISAFIWQSGLDGQLPKQPAGDPVKGKESFETRGCMGCHSVGEGSNPVADGLPPTSAGWERRITTITWCAGFTIPASAPTLTALMKNAT